MSNENHGKGCVCRACMGKNPAPNFDPNEPPGGDPRWKMVGDHWFGHSFYDLSNHQT